MASYMVTRDFAWVGEYLACYGLRDWRKFKHWSSRRKCCFCLHEPSRGEHIGLGFISSILVDPSKHHGLEELLFRVL